MQAQYKGAIVGWIFGFITASILWFFRVPSLNAYILDILSPIFILIGTVLMALYPINVSYFERNTRFMEKLTFIKGHDGPFKDFERQNIIVGIGLISLGIVIQIYANWIQSH